MRQSSGIPLEIPGSDVRLLQAEVLVAQTILRHCHPPTVRMAPRVFFPSPFPSFSPFAGSSEDTAEEILAQIGSGKVCVTGGNWELVSDAAKVKKKKKKV